MAESFEDYGDLKFYYGFLPPNAPGPADIRVTGAVLHRDPGFETANLISLGSDARAEEQDVLPQGFKSHSGFWGSAVTGDEIGSKLWLLGRSVITEEVLRQAEQWVRESLQWKIDDGIDADIRVTATRGGENQINFIIREHRTLGDVVNQRYYINWEAQRLGRLA
jgi:phage gp46-like protein